MPSLLNAALISRTITIDGVFSDWHQVPDLTTNPGQFASDCAAGQVCELDTISGSGRDLATFSFTWDQNNLYLYVARHAAASPTTDWLFYLDEDADGFMETGERILRMQWRGSNQNTIAQLCPYFPQDTVNGDPIMIGGVSDGYTMPGSSANSCSNVYAGVTGGSASGLEMESRLAWSLLGFSGPNNIGFHVSSSNGINLPSQVVDNVNPPAGSNGQLFAADMEITLTDSVGSQVQGNKVFTFDVTLSNLFFDDFTNVTSSVALPAQLEYQSFVAPAGTSFVDTDADMVPDEWQVPALLASQSLVLEITVLAQNVPFVSNVDIVANITGSAEPDASVSNNTDTLTVAVHPAPELLVLKSSSSALAAPATEVTFTSLIANTSSLDAQTIVATENLPDYSCFKLGSVGASAPPPPYNNSGLSILSVDYFDGTSWGYVPVSGGGGAPSGYDGRVEQIEVSFAGTIAPNEAVSLDFTIVID